MWQVSFSQFEVFILTLFMVMIDRVPDELRIEVRDIVQEIGIKTMPKKKKCKKAKWVPEEALQIAVKGRGVKSKGERKDIPI